MKAKRQQPAAIGREHRPALIVCLTARFIAFLDVSIVNVALPTISTHLHARRGRSAYPADQRHHSAAVPGRTARTGIRLLRLGGRGVDGGGTTCRGALIAAFGASDGWRSVFYVNVPIGLVLIPGAVMYLPRHTHRTGQRPGLDPGGVGLLGLGIVLVLLPLIQDSWGSWRWSLLAAAAAMLAVFIAAAGAAFFASLHRHCSYTSAYRNGIFVTTAITAAALVLALIDRHQARTRGSTSKPLATVSFCLIPWSAWPGAFHGSLWLVIRGFRARLH
jgi:hypothetical protein